MKRSIEAIGSRVSTQFVESLSVQTSLLIMLDDQERNRTNNPGLDHHVDVHVKAAKYLLCRVYWMVITVSYRSKSGHRPIHSTNVPLRYKSKYKRDP
jgi:hypothetical protein